MELLSEALSGKIRKKGFQNASVIYNIVSNYSPAHMGM